MDHENRVVVLIDMDCFYCQVEEKLNPELKGKPIAVVQYNPWKGGGIIAVNYEARAMGVTRSMRGDEAREKCPDIQLPSVPCQRGKADISIYREAGKEVARVLQKFSMLLERASIDEAYLDITASVNQRLKTLDVNAVTTDMMPNTFALGYDCVDDFVADIQSCGAESIDFDYEHAKRLLVGAVIVSEIRTAVYAETGYRCSAGIAHNRILAKLVCGMNKPNKQTVLPKHSINILYKTLPLKKVKHLGGKFGDAVCDVLRIKVMSELQKFSEKELQTRFDEKNGTWLYNIARGIDLEPVTARFNPKSIGCCKQFRGKSALTDLESLRKWLKDLGDEIEDRLEKDALENNRSPKQMVVSYSVQMADGRDTSSSRSYNFSADDELCGEMFSGKALELIVESSEGIKPKVDDCNRKLKSPIKFLGISVGKFEDNVESKKTKKIVDYFTAGSSKDVEKNTKTDTQAVRVPEDKKSKNNEGKDYIMKKFFQVSEKAKENPNSEHINATTTNEVKTETSLDKQESFFAKMLSSNTKDTKAITANPSNLYTHNEHEKPTTPICEVIKCGDDSNDTDYSSSTINNEINKSIALFEENVQDVARVSNIRQLLNSTNLDVVDRESPVDSKGAESPKENYLSDDNKEEEVKESVTIVNEQKSPEKAIFNCSECKKRIPANMFEEHADYHLALKLREEERQMFRQEKIDRVIQRKENEKAMVPKKKEKQEESVRNETVSSIASFLVKIDNSIPTEMCSECGKRVAVKQFAEHLDFHEAQKLSRELNKKSVLFTTANSYPSTGSSVKRKKKFASPVKKPKLQCKSIDSFFR